jgi:formiminoglutamase
MEGILRSLEEEGDLVFFSFDIDSINSAYCPGVSAPSVVGGLTDEEALELCYLAGRYTCVRLMDCSEFNPAVEDQRTRRLLANMFFNFCRGIADRELKVTCLI